MLEIKDLQIKYSDFVAIDQVNISVQKGEFFTFLGPSGCGKTTTLRAIAGFLTPSRGSVQLNEKDLLQVPVEKRNLGMVFNLMLCFLR